MRNKSIIIHSFLFAILPIISLLSYNIESVVIRDIIRPAFLSLIATTILLVLLWVVVKDITVSGIITTLTLIFFFSYGHVYGGFLHFSLAKLMGIGGFIGKHIYLLIGWILLLILCIWIIIRLKRYALDISNGLNLINIVC